MIRHQNHQAGVYENKAKKKRVNVEELLWADVLICHDWYVGIDDWCFNSLVIPFG